MIAIIGTKMIMIEPGRISYRSTAAIIAADVPTGLRTMFGRGAGGEWATFHERSHCQDVPSCNHVIM